MPKVTIKVQGVVIEQPFFVIPMGKIEVVLGLDWLASLGKVEANFEALTLSWTAGGRRLEVHGDPTLG